MVMTVFCMGFSRKANGLLFQKIIFRAKANFNFIKINKNQASSYYKISLSCYKKLSEPLVKVFIIKHYTDLI